MWENGAYHGHGRKLYSRGGGYEGNWVHGLREGDGVSFYDGLHGFARWEGILPSPYHEPRVLLINYNYDCVNV